MSSIDDNYYYRFLTFIYKNIYVGNRIYILNAPNVL